MLATVAEKMKLQCYCNFEFIKKVYTGITILYTFKAAHVVSRK